LGPNRAKFSTGMFLLNFMTGFAKKWVASARSTF